MSIETETLQDLERHLQEQAKILDDARAKIYEREGRQTAKWWEVSEQEDPVARYGLRLLEYAQYHRDSSDAMSCLAYLFQRGEGENLELHEAACDELLARHAHNPVLSWFCAHCTNPLSFDVHERFLKRLAQATHNDVVRTAAEFHRAELLDNAIQRRLQGRTPVNRLEQSGLFDARPEIRERFERLQMLDMQAITTERDKLLRQIRKSGRQVRHWSATKRSGTLGYDFHADESAETYAAMAEGLIYEIEYLREGKRAPDFTATLADGQTFRLNNHRGAPLLLLFCHDGCGACEALYPALRHVQKRFSDRGFTVIGVMADEQLETLHRVIGDGEITWPCIWDGKAGPVAGKYRVHAYPTVLLLDGNGRIIARNLRTERELMSQIETLLKPSRD